MDLRQILGANVRGFRTLQELSREEFCELGNMNVNHLGALERGEENVTIDTLAKLAIVLGIEPWALLVPGSHKWATRNRIGSQVGIPAIAGICK
jgi:transcriptional regulator with XRE-family HTH domain